MIKKKGHIRFITIDGEKWAWIVEAHRWAGAVKEVRIYNPYKQMYRVDPEKLTTERTWVGVEGEFATNIKPSQIKNYILKEIKK